MGRNQIRQFLCLSIENRPSANLGEWPAVRRPCRRSVARITPRFLESDVFRRKRHPYRRRARKQVHLTIENRLTQSAGVNRPRVEPLHSRERLPEAGSLSRGHQQLGVAGSRHSTTHSRLYIGRIAFEEDSGQLLTLTTQVKGIVIRGSRSVFAATAMARQPPPHLPKAEQEEQLLSKIPRQSRRL